MKTNFYTNVFRNCQFLKVDLEWSCFTDCEFIKTKFQEILLEGATISNLKTKATTFLNLQFHETFPMKFYKSNSNEYIEVKDSSSFEKFLRDIN